MLVLFIVLLLCWMALAIVGVLVKALAWLAIVGVVLFVGTIVVAAVTAWKG